AQGAYRRLRQLTLRHLAGVAVMNERIKTIALTIGDPNGIGPEIAVKAAAGLRGNRNIRVILVGDEHVIRHHGARCAQRITFLAVSHVAASASEDTILVHPVHALPTAHFHPGAIDAEAGRATVAYVEAAIDLIREGVA